jgi:hypothetical protein
MRKVLLLICVFFIARSLLSCCGDSNYDFRWTKANLTNNRYSGSMFQSLITDSIKVKDYILRLSFDHEKIGGMLQNGFGFNSAYATKCIWNQNNLDTIISVNLVTLRDFDANHSAGTSLNDLPIARSGFSLFDTIANPSRQIAQVTSSLNQRYDGSAYADIYFFFEKTNPFLSQQEFEITVTCASGRKLSDTAFIRFY